MLRVPLLDLENEIRTGVVLWGMGGGVRERRSAGIFIKILPKFFGLLFFSVQVLAAFSGDREDKATIFLGKAVQPCANGKCIIFGSNC